MNKKLHVDIRQTKSPLAILILFSVSLLFYSGLALWFNQNWISNDGGAYHKMAVNLAEGRGFSKEIQQPYDKQFFREPGYPFYVSMACQINKLLGNENNFLDTSKMDNKNRYPDSHTELIILRFLQAIIASFIVVLFFFIMCRFLAYRDALVVAFLFIFYLPFAYNVTQTMRELLVTLQLVSINYLVIRSGKSDRTLLYDSIIGLVAVSLILTLQAYVFILPFFLLSSYMISRDLRKTVKSWTIISLLIIAGTTPWIYRAYKEYPDVRVAKTFGVSYTYEMKKYFDANAKALWIDFNGEGKHYREVLNNEYWVPGRVQFERSFNGYYKSKADSLIREIHVQELNTASKRIKFTLKHILINNYRKSLYWPIWRPNYPQDISSALSSEHRFSMVLSMIAGGIVLLFFVWGLIVKLKATWIYLPIFTFHFLMIPLLADEGRRVIPFLPFYFMFGVLGFNDITVRLRSRFNPTESTKKETHQALNDNRICHE